MKQNNCVLFCTSKKPFILTPCFTPIVLTKLWKTAKLSTFDNTLGKFI